MAARPPKAVFAANSATKWLVAAGNTVAVCSRRDFISPYIVVGSIVATFGTDALKRTINQQRPAGAPFTDPGMPSSHALVSSFLAVGWCTAASSVPMRVALLAIALAISLLRVFCGYHSYPQVAVGALIGGLSAGLWMALGTAILALAEPRTAFVAAWSAYLGGSAFFIARKMASWTGKHRASW
jgi:membrane-associated phospholipid phosphatase